MGSPENLSKRTRVTTRKLGDLLLTQLDKLECMHQERPDLLLSAWPQMLGPKLAPMTEAQEFREGILFVKVKNSTLNYLLNRHEKLKLLRKLRSKFPKVLIRDIKFRVG